MLTRKRARRKRVAEICCARLYQALGCFGILLQQSHRDDLSLVRTQLLQSERLYRSQLAVDLDLRQLTDREIEVADLVRDQQHAFDNGRQIEEAHAEQHSI